MTQCQSMNVRPSWTASTEYSKMGVPLVRPFCFICGTKWNYSLGIWDDMMNIPKKGGAVMTYKDAKVYIEYIKVLLDNYGLNDVELTNALNAAQQALDYEVIPFILPTELPTDLLKGRKIAVYRE